MFEQSTKDSGDPSTLSVILQWMLARGLEGESQIKEEIQWSPKSKALLHLAQMGVALISLVMVGGGAFALGGSLASAFTDAGDVKGWLLIGSVSLALALLAIRGIVYWLQNLNDWTAWALVLLLSLFIGGGIVFASSEGEWSYLNLALFILGAALLVPGMAGTYRMLSDIFDPFGKTSPLERRLFPLIDQLFLGQAQQQPAPPGAIPWRRGGKIKATSRAIEPSEHLLLTREEAALLEFLELSEVRGLERSSWLVPDTPNVRLPHSGVEVGREQFDGLIDLAAHWRFIEKRGPRKTPQRLVSAKQAEEIILEEAERRMPWYGEEELAA